MQEWYGEVKERPLPSTALHVGPPATASHTSSLGDSRGILAHFLTNEDPFHQGTPQLPWSQRRRGDAELQWVVHVECLQMHSPRIRWPYHGQQMEHVGRTAQRKHGSAGQVKRKGKNATLPMGNNHQTGCRSTAVLLPCGCPMSHVGHEKD